MERRGKNGREMKGVELELWTATRRHRRIETYSGEVLERVHRLTKKTIGLVFILVSTCERKNRNDRQSRKRRRRTTRPSNEP